MNNCHPERQRIRSGRPLPEHEPIRLVILCINLRIGFGSTVLWTLCSGSFFASGTCDDAALRHAREDERDRLRIYAVQERKK